MSHSDERLSVAQLDRYLAGVADPDERQGVESWIAADPARRALWKSIQQEGPSARARAALERVLAASTNTPHEARIGGRFGVGLRAGGLTNRGWRWGGGVAGAAVVAGLLWVVGIAGPRTSAPAPRRVYTTGAGQRADLTLDDGTRVALAERTTLRLADFGASARTVVVDGEAYFNVARASGAPFVVQSGGVSARALGTAFLVRHAAGDARVQVSVADGKVLVVPRVRAAASVTLTAGQAASVSDSLAHVSTVDEAAPSREWVQGRLVFRHTSVERVLDAVGEWYGYHVRCADTTLAKLPVTVWLSAESSASALATLERLLSVDLAVTGDTVTLTPRAVPRGKRGTRPHAYEVWTPTREVGR